MIAPGRALLLALLMVSTQLRADGINNPKSGGTGGGQVGFIEGVNNLGVGGSAVVSPCTGAIDLSAGCVLPMLGGL